MTQPIYDPTPTHNSWQQGWQFLPDPDTQPGPTLMGRILPGPFRNRVGYGLKKKNPKRVQVGSEFYLKNPDPTHIKTRIKIRYPKLQKYPNIYIYSYNLTLTNPSFFNLQSSAAAQHSPQNSVPFPQPIRGTHSLPHFCTVRSAQSTQSSVRSAQSRLTPYASLSLSQSRPVRSAQPAQPSPISSVRSTQSRPLTVTLSLSLF